MILASVVLPEPDGPASPTISPEWIEISSWSRTGIDVFLSLKLFVIFEPSHTWGLVFLFDANSAGEPSWEALEPSCAAVESFSASFRRDSKVTESSRSTSEGGKPGIGTMPPEGSAASRARVYGS